MELDCRGRGLPFPHVDPSPEEQRQPRECHLFLDPDCPDAPAVLHFPLVNASFKDHSAPGEKLPFLTAYPTHQRHRPGPAQCPCSQQREDSLKGDPISLGQYPGLLGIPTSQQEPSLCKVKGLLFFVS